MIMRFVALGDRADLLVLKQRLESETVVPVIDRTYALAEVPDALEYLEKGHATGKVVITVADA
jgi:NADPH:quinone reductase-like Zn-dependent oxidoreductase